MRKFMKSVALILATAMCLGVCGCSSKSKKAEINTENYLEDAVKSFEGTAIDNKIISSNNFKELSENNPVSSEFFCADPTSIEYDGRLYLIGTNDHQQYDVIGSEKDNSYEQIKSFVIMSTDDMVNWVYHGEINVEEIAPWITNSWAPSITSRVEDDGLTHFYLYFSNNGLGVGVITTTDLLGEWEDPLGEPLISSSTEGLKNCPNPFDPGVVIDDNGDGWLAFGGGNASGTDYMPGSSKIVKLGSDMISFASDFVDIPAPYFFEASELNYINGTYIYTYNTDWNDHSAKWDYECEAPTMCSMVYMTTDTPLDSDSWQMKGEYFKNPGLSGLDYSNNHTHLQKYNGNYYIFYHTLMLKGGMGIKGAYRSLGVDTITVDEENVTIEPIGATKNGIQYVTAKNPYEENKGVELNNTADVDFSTIDKKNPIVISKSEGAWISVKNVEFTEPYNIQQEETNTQDVVIAIDTIKYKINAKEVSKETIISMYPSIKDGDDCIGSVNVAEPGEYEIECDLGSNEKIQNMGYFSVDNDALVTMDLESIIINDTYEMNIQLELTNTVDWSNGLKNIWSVSTDGEVLYSCDDVEFRYVEADGAIELFTKNGQNGNIQDGPEVDDDILFAGVVKGKGRIEVRLDAPDGDMLTYIDFDTKGEYSKIYNELTGRASGRRDLYFVFSDAELELLSWRFCKK